jgi:hypothetical protein
MRQNTVKRWITSYEISLIMFKFMNNLCPDIFSVGLFPSLSLVTYPTPSSRYPLG